MRKTAPPMTWLTPIAVRSHLPSSRREMGSDRHFSEASDARCDRIERSRRMGSDPYHGAGVHVSNRATTMPRTALTLPARYYTDPAVFDREMRALLRRMWVGVGRVDRSRARRLLPCGTSPATASSSRADDAGRVRAFYNVCRHRGTQLCAEPAGHVRRLASSARITPGPTTRRPADRRAAHGRVPDFRKEDYPARRVALRTSGTATCSLASRTNPRAAAGRSWRRCPRSSRRGAWPISALGHRIVYDVQGELEADHPELQRVPALPDPASGAEQAVALPQRRERAAAADLHGRTDGSATGRRDDVDGRHVPARVPARAVRPTIAAASTTTRSSRTCSSACTPTTC